MDANVTIQGFKRQIDFEPLYMEPNATAGYQNVALTSREGNQCRINSLIFASLSKMAYQMMENADQLAGEDFYIKTEFSDSELLKICKFATTGRIDGFKSEKELLQDDVTVVMFQSFGVDLSNLSFTLQYCSSVPGKIYANEDKIIINNMEVPSEWKEVVKDSSLKEEGDSNTELEVGPIPSNDQEVLEDNFDLLDDEPDFANEDVPETFEQNTNLL